MYVKMLLTAAFTVGLTMLDWDYLAENLEVLKPVERRALLCACHIPVTPTMDDDDVLEILMDIL